MVYTTELLADNIPNSLRVTVPVNNPSAKKSLRQFSE